ncbi:response regulator [Neorhizobium sp. NCHU2750]|uniref:response regulator n=1 Tax=Neorhizobium sp. NCHU2750 TaxID=1825976 RepID=UPI000E721B4E|nr:transcriptional regulator [Neorhizobium sp. NCHU2750]
MPDKLILLLEDQPLISLDIEEALVEKGMRNLVTLRSRKEALDWLSQSSPDFVLLDLYLDDGDSQPVLERLQQAGIPFMIYTGSERPSEWDASLFEGSEWMSKPGDPDALADRIKTRLAPSSRPSVG